MIPSDIQTWLFAHALVATTLGVLLLVLWRRHHDIPSLAYWATGTLLIGLSTLGLATRELLPGWTVTVVTNACGVLGMGVTWNGIRIFAGKPSRWHVLAAVTVLVLLALSWWTFADPWPRARTLLVTSLLSAGAAFSARELFDRKIGDDVRAIADWAGWIFVVIAVANGFRAATSLLQIGTATELQPVSLQAIALIAPLVTNILSVACFLLLVAERFQAALTARAATLQALADERDVARNRAEQANRAKAEFLATVSHELRTPLNAIIGLSDMQRQEPFGPMGHPRYRDYADDVHSSGLHLLQLVEAMLDTSRLEAGHYQIAPETVELAPLLQKVQGICRGAAEAKSLSFTVAAAGGRCWADPRALTQVLANLITNAIKFTMPGGIVQVTAESQTDGSARFVVTDDGSGMDPDELPRLLRPFEQAASSYARREGGCGLGLAVVDSLIALHGGALRFDTAPGRGTKAIFILPPGPDVTPDLFPSEPFAIAEAAPA